MSYFLVSSSKDASTDARVRETSGAACSDVDVRSFQSYLRPARRIMTTGSVNLPNEFNISKLSDEIAMK